MRAGECEAGEGPARDARIARGELAHPAALVARRIGIELALVCELRHASTAARVVEAPADGRVAKPRRGGEHVAHRALLELAVPSIDCLMLSGHLGAAAARDPFEGAGVGGPAWDVFRLDLQIVAAEIGLAAVRTRNLRRRDVRANVVRIGVEVIVDSLARHGCVPLPAGR